MFSVLKNMLNVAIGISPRTYKITCSVEMLVFHVSIVSHFHLPCVFSINGYIASIIIFRERISEENIIFVGGLVRILFIESLEIVGTSLFPVLVKAFEFIHFKFF